MSLPGGVRPRPSTVHRDVPMSQRTKFLEHIYEKLIALRAKQDQHHPSDRQLAELAEVVEAQVYDESNGYTYKSRIASRANKISSDDLGAAASFPEPEDRSRMSAPSNVEVVDLTSSSPHGSNNGSRGVVDLTSTSPQGSNNGSRGGSSSHGSKVKEVSSRGSRRSSQRKVEAESSAAVEAEIKRARREGPQSVTRELLPVVAPPPLGVQPSDEVPSPTSWAANPMDDEDAAGDAQFSDAEDDGPPTPSAEERSRLLEAEAASFSLEGVVPADAWQPVCRACGRELVTVWDEARSELVVRDAVMFRHVIFHQPCALKAMPSLPSISSGAVR